MTDDMKTTICNTPIVVGPNHCHTHWYYRSWTPSGQILGDEPEQGIDGYGGKDWENERFKTRVETAIKNVNNRSMTRGAELRKYLYIYMTIYNDAHEPNLWNCHNCRLS